MLSTPIATETALQNEFEAQFHRIFEAAECRTQIELAKFLELKQPAIADAKRRKAIPPQWLITLLKKRNINPYWISCGMGAKYLVAADSKLLHEYPAQDLINELVRRALQQDLNLAELIIKLAY